VNINLNLSLSKEIEAYVMKVRRTAYSTVQKSTRSYANSLHHLHENPKLDAIVRIY
jgi:hypothetical protein